MPVVRERFIAAMDDDLNTAQAISVLFDPREINRAGTPAAPSAGPGVLRARGVLAETEAAQRGDAGGTAHRATIDRQGTARRQAVRAS
jgi:cysteinyl-tRNA synthetase